MWHPNHNDDHSSLRPNTETADDIGRNTQPALCLQIRAGKATMGEGPSVLLGRHVQRRGKLTATLLWGITKNSAATSSTHGSTHYSWIVAKWDDRPPIREQHIDKCCKSDEWTCGSFGREDLSTSQWTTLELYTDVQQCICSALGR